jgi:hypothetical protein
MGSPPLGVVESMHAEAEQRVKTQSSISDREMRQSSEPFDACAFRPPHWRQTGTQFPAQF